jgi:hypothetical protein
LGADQHCRRRAQKPDFGGSFLLLEPTMTEEHDNDDNEADRPVEKRGQWRRSSRATTIHKINTVLNKAPHCENPFRVKSLDDYRRNFPPFENVFTDTAISSNGTRCRDIDNDLPESTTNWSTVSTSSILSISARAAVNADNRRIARYGIGGEEDDIDAVQETTLVDAGRNAKNQRWEELNCNDEEQRERANTSSASLSSGSPQDVSNSSRVVISTSADGSTEEIEVSSDVSLAVDEMYFQSDRVEALRTPERYYNTNTNNGTAIGCSFPSPTRRRNDNANTSIASSAVESETQVMLRLALAGTSGHNTSASSSSSSSSAITSYNGTAFLLVGPSSPWSDSRPTRPSRQEHLYPFSFSERVKGQNSVSGGGGGEASNTNDSFLLNHSAISTSSSGDHHVSVTSILPALLPKPPPMPPK